MDQASIAIVVADRSLRPLVAGAFDSAPLDWEVGFYDSAPLQPTWLSSTVLAPKEGSCSTLGARRSSSRRFKPASKDRPGLLAAASR
jgi:hypothetical protein